jgi:hypothetical protein
LKKFQIVIIFLGHSYFLLDFIFIFYSVKSNKIRFFEAYGKIKETHCVDLRINRRYWKSYLQFIKVLVQYLLTSELWTKIIVVVRRELEEWKNHPKKDKLVVELLNDMDKLLEPLNFKYDNVDAVFCCLGSQVKHGNEVFIKIDKTYPLCAAEIALNNSISKNNIKKFLNT